MRPHFHVAGFPVRVHPLFFLTVLATGWSWLDEPARLASWCGVVFVSVLVHELGHALAFRRHGCPARIELHGLGGTTTGRDEGRLSHRQSAWVSIAGPLAGFILGGLVWGLEQALPMRHAGGLAGQVMRQLLWANIGWGLFNLLPMQPLDGGHLLASAVRARAGYRHERALHVVGIVTAVAVLALAVAWRMTWLGMLALLFGVMNVEALRRTPREPTPPRVTAPRSPAPPRDEDAETASRSAARLPGARESSPERTSLPGVRLPGARESSSERRATASRLASGKEEPESPPDARLVGELLLDGGLYALAVRPLREAFTATPSARAGHALTVALLETGRHADLAALLDGPGATHLGRDTLTLIAERADAAGQTALATRARALREASTPKRNEPR